MTDMDSRYPWLSVMDPLDMQLSDDEILRWREVRRVRTRRVAVVVSCLLTISTVASIVVTTAG